MPKIKILSKCPNSWIRTAKNSLARILTRMLFSPSIAKTWVSLWFRNSGMSYHPREFIMSYLSKQKYRTATSTSGTLTLMLMSSVLWTEWKP
jgi:hypothetical protein